MVVNDLQEKYGASNIARVVAFGKMMPKAVCRKVLSFFEIDKAIITAVAKLIPDLCKSMEDAYADNPNLLKYKKDLPMEFKVIERLSGRISHESQHAGGVVILNDLSKQLPVKIDMDDRKTRICAYDKYMLEDLGFIKFDVLGLETLPIIKNTLDFIKQNKGIDVDLNMIDYDDANIYDMLCMGDVSGVFQLANQAHKVKQQMPRNFVDLIAINALIRPGVGDWNEYINRRFNGYTSTDPNRKHLAETYDIITYQEQFMLDCHILAGWDMAYVDRKVRKNKDIVHDDELKAKFYLDSKSNGYKNDYVESVWDYIVDAVSGGYSFNKSHSASYAITSFETAYLKYYYPVEFYASMMSSEPTDGVGQSNVSRYINECKSRGIEILPPDINNGTSMFIPSGNTISFRMTSLSDLGDSAIKSIEKMRPIASYNDFMDRRVKKEIRDNVVVNIIKAGCFDSIDNFSREHLLWTLSFNKLTKTQIKNGVVPPKIEVNENTYSKWEYDALGMFLSNHPLSKHEFADFNKIKEGDSAVIGGWITEVKLVTDKNRNQMAFVTINTEHGDVRCIAFSSIYKSYKRILVPKSISNVVILVDGKRSGDSLLMNEIEVFDEDNS